MKIVNDILIQREGSGYYTLKICDAQIDSVYTECMHMYHGNKASLLVAW